MRGCRRGMPRGLKPSSLPELIAALCHPKSFCIQIVLHKILSAYIFFVRKAQGCSDGNALWGAGRCGQVRGPSTTQVLALSAQVLAALRMTRKGVGVMTLA